MAVELSKLKALTIRQPWADLIIRGLKTIEVREWQVKHRGPFLIHTSNTVDWKAVQTLGYDEVEELPRGRVIGYAEISEVFQFDRERWLDRLKDHWVVHPLPEPSFGAVLTNVRVFEKPVRCRGNRYFFLLPQAVLDAVGKNLRAQGVEVETAGGAGSPTNRESRP